MKSRCDYAVVDYAVLRLRRQKHGDLHKPDVRGLRAYAAANTYPPNDGVYNVIPLELTAPVACLTNGLLVDPFSDKLIDPVYGELARYRDRAKLQRRGGGDGLRDYALRV